MGLQQTIAEAKSVLGEQTSAALKKAMTDLLPEIHNTEDATYCITAIAEQLDSVAKDMDSDAKDLASIRNALIQAVKDAF